MIHTDNCVNGKMLVSGVRTEAWIHADTLEDTDVPLQHTHGEATWWCYKSHLLSPYHRFP